MGAGFYEREHAGLGITLPPVAERMRRLEETLQIALQMWRGDVKEFHGRHYDLAETLNVPQSLQRPHPPILIGGGGEKRTLSIVARYGDATNLFGAQGIEGLQHKLDVLREHCRQHGRDYNSIEKTVQVQMDMTAGVEAVGPFVDQMHAYAELGFTRAIGSVRDIQAIRPLETIVRDVMPQIESF
jgi:alkanesulfonate monooxygenase SsuD/methylene tetrahydromethanopterin reductase-like flavin-dependent oxidoreductase (luciferase family)